MLKESSSAKLKKKGESLCRGGARAGGVDRLASVRALAWIRETRQDKLAGDARKMYKHARE